MRCYFDVLRRVHLDTTGVEAADLGGVLAGVKQAIAEVLSEDYCAVDFTEGTFLLVRADTDGLVGVIPLNDSTEECSDSCGTTSEEA